MKKILALACAAMLVTGFISCGQSEEERKADSTEVAKTATNMNDEADSTIAAMNHMNDSIVAAGKADSTKKADSAAKAQKK